LAIGSSDTALANEIKRRIIVASYNIPFTPTAASVSSPFETFKGIATACTQRLLTHNYSFNGTQWLLCPKSNKTDDFTLAKKMEYLKQNGTQNDGIIDCLIGCAPLHYNPLHHRPLTPLRPPNRQHQPLPPKSSE